jgi:hypothetical protein
MYLKTGGKNLGHTKEMQYNYSKRKFTGRTKAIRTISDADNRRPDNCSYNVHEYPQVSLIFTFSFLCILGQSIQFECTRFYQSHNITTLLLLHVAGLTGTTLSTPKIDLLYKKFSAATCRKH